MIRAIFLRYKMLFGNLIASITQWQCPCLAGNLIRFVCGGESHSQGVSAALCCQSGEMAFLILAAVNKAPKVGFQTTGQMWLLHCPPFPTPQPLALQLWAWLIPGVYLHVPTAAIIISLLNCFFQVCISLITNVRKKEYQDCFGLLSKIGILSWYSYSLGARVVMGGRWF